MPQEIKTTLDFKNVGRIINLPDGVDPQDAATVAQLATGVGTATWGGITGTLSDQSDLLAAFDAEEPLIATGTTSQYWRGDKTWQSFESSVLDSTLSGLSITGGSIASGDNVLLAFGKLQNQINGVLGGATYQGVWNATTNSPALASGAGTKGYYYVVSVNGTTNLDGITDWKVGDWAIFNGTTWDKVDNTDAVSSVNGAIGAISLAGTASRITVSGTTFDIASTYAGQSSITSVGTIATGTWQGTTIASSYGGTGLTTYATGDILYASATNVLSKLSAGTDGKVLTMASGVPSWATAAGGLPSQSGNSGKFLTTDGTAASWGALTGWSTTGTAASNPPTSNTSAIATGTNFIGTTDNKDFVIGTNNTQRLRISADGAAVTMSGLSISPGSALSYLRCPRLRLESNAVTSNYLWIDNFGVQIGSSAGITFNLSGSSNIMTLEAPSLFVSKLSMITRASNGTRANVICGRDLQNAALAGVPFYIYGAMNTENGSVGNTILGIDETGVQRGNILIGTQTDIPSAKMVISSVTKGSIPAPKMTKSQRNSITSPTGGLQVIVTGETGGEYLSWYNSSTSGWVKVTSTAD